MGALVLGGVALWLTRGSWMPRPADTVTVTPATVPPETVAPPATAAAPADKTVTAAIVSAPPGARVVREKDGAVIGMTPFRETWPGGEGVTKLRLELDGFRTESVVVPLDCGVDLSFALHKVAQPEPHKRKETKQAPAEKVPPAAPRPRGPAPKSPPGSEPVPL